MKNDHWKEILAAIGVILSLLFVGYEINQNSRVARAQVRSDLAAMNQEQLVLLSSDPQYYELWYKAWRSLSDEQLSEIDTMRASMMMRLNLRKQENVYLQFSEGLLDESGLSSYGLAGGPVFQTARFSEFWRNGRGDFDPGFVNWFEERNNINVEN